MKTIKGRERADFIKGTSSSEIILGLGGNDLINAGGGDDQVSGGNGNDSIHGGTGNDTLSGDAGDDSVFGDNGDDKISGGIGNDRLYGGDGNDTLADISGRDTFTGGSGFDVVDYSASKSARGVDVFLHLGHGGRDALGDHYAGIEGAIGTNAQDFLWGDNNANVFTGLNGNDFMRAFSGDDTFYGGAGNDQMHGDDGNDTFFLGTDSDIADGGAGMDWVNMGLEKVGVTFSYSANTFTGDVQLFNGSIGDQAYGVEGLRGTGFDDTLDLAGRATVGFMSFYVLDGGAGNDQLTGAALYYGGLGEDTIHLSTGAISVAETVALQLDMGFDKISSFDASTGDRLQVSLSEFGIGGTTASPVFNWVNSTDAPVALTPGAAFIYETTTHVLWFDADGTDAGVPIAVAGFYAPVAAPVAADLLFVA